MSEDTTKTGQPADPNAGGEQTPDKNQDKNADIDPQSVIAQKNHFRDKFNERDARVKELEAELEAKKQEELEQKEEWKTIAEQNDEKAKEALNLVAQKDSLLKKQAVNFELTKHLTKHNPVDVNDVIRLIDTEGIEVGDDYTVSGADKVVESFVESKPHLFGKAAVTVNGDAGTSGGEDKAKGGRIYTRAEIAAMSTAELKANQEDIRLAKREGRIQ